MGGACGTVSVAAWTLVAMRQVQVRQFGARFYVTAGLYEKYFGRGAAAQCGNHRLHQRSTPKPSARVIACARLQLPRTCLCASQSKKKQRACSGHAGSAAAQLPAQSLGCSPTPDLAELFGLPASQAPCLQACLCAPPVLQRNVLK